MVGYKCFSCGRKVSHKVLEKSRGKCTYCDSRIFYKTRNVVTRVKAV